MPSVLIVEDNPKWQRAIEQLLMLAPTYSVCGVVASYDDALVQYQALRPDWVLLDWQLTGKQTGIDVANALQAHYGHSPEQLILISGSNPTDIPEHSLKAIGKGQLAKELLGYLQKESAAA